MPWSIELFDAFAAGVYLLFGIVHLDLGLRRPEARGHLWLAGASFSALAVDLTGLALRGVVVPSSLWLGVLNLTAVAAATVCLFELVTALGRRRSRSAARALEWTLLLLAPLAALRPEIVPPGVVFALVLALLAVSMARALRLARGSDREARLLAAGFAVLIVCLVLDVAMELGLVPRREGLPIVGFVVLFLSAAKSLADQAEREHRELDGLRRELERRVDERTAELQEANRRLAEASRTDALTGLPNRRGFLEASAAEIERCRRSGRLFSIVLADVDRFKGINDTLGHAAGDAALRAVAQRIRSSLRGQDLVARWGGEEFILLLPETEAPGAMHLAETVRAAIAAEALELESGPLRLTASFGVAQAERGSRLESTIAAADRALYRAKDAGRNRVEAG